VQIKLSTKSRNDIPGLISGKNYALRIAAVRARCASVGGGLRRTQNKELKKSHPP